MNSCLTGDTGSEEPEVEGLGDSDVPCPGDAVNVQRACEEVI